MSKRKTRDRQLARLAARRAAERRRRKRQRIVAGVVAVALAAGGGTGLYIAFAGGSKKGNQAQGTPSAQPSGKVKHGTGKKTGTVKTKPAPEAVACGAQAPKSATKPKPQFDGPPPLTVHKSATYIAVMKTSCGAITIKLLAKDAPETVNSFVFLARHGFFNGQYFHRIDTSIDVLQGGDPSGTGGGGPGYTIPDEMKGKPSYGPGTLAMANTGKPNTGGSQFFLIVGPKGHNLDSCTQGPACYTIFGKVTKGLDVGQKIEKIPVVDPRSISTQTPKQAIYIVSVKILTKK
jgi:peptidyl-prolyl cis-trans isomerase B (cyclophilin B)